MRWFFNPAFMFGRPQFTLLGFTVCWRDLWDGSTGLEVIGPFFVFSRGFKNPRWTPRNERDALYHSALTEEER